MCEIFSLSDKVTILLFCFFNDTATTEIYTLSLHDALPIYSTVIGANAVSTADNEIILGNGTQTTCSFPAAVVSILNSTDSSSSTTGSLIVSGGAGIVKNLNVGGDLAVNGLVDLWSKDFSFATSSVGAATSYVGGFYRDAGTNNDLSGAQSLGTALSSYGAKVYVVLGANTVDTISITVSGTSWVASTGTRTAADTEVIQFTHPAVVDDYIQTTKAWIGQVTLQTTAGTAKSCNYGFARYFNANEATFSITGFSSTWLAGATDAGFNVEVLHHKTSGWTYTAGGATPPAALWSMETDYGVATESKAIVDEEGSWERTSLSQAIAGGSNEGVLIRLTSSVASAIRFGTFSLAYK